MSESPPAYSEAPHEDLVAELAKMKTMMEQMRLDKERLETEAKRKAEEDAAIEVTRKREQEEMLARLRMEQEEARELEEIHKRCHETSMRVYWNYIDDRHKARLTSIAQYETVLFYEHHEGRLTYIITNKNIYRDYHIMYTFDTVLTKKQTLFLEKSVRGDCPDGKLLGRVSFCHYNTNLGRDCYMSAPKKFESIIRLIPGSYKNGDWRQLDGFFGMYFNEATMEISEVPPPL
jgi:hypothetical protein